MHLTCVHIVNSYSNIDASSHNSILLIFDLSNCTDVSLFARSLRWILQQPVVDLCLVLLHPEDVVLYGLEGLLAGTLAWGEK